MPSDNENRIYTIYNRTTGQYVSNIDKFGVDYTDSLDGALLFKNYKVAKNRCMKANRHFSCQGCCIRSFDKEKPDISNMREGKVTMKYISANCKRVR